MGMKLHKFLCQHVFVRFLALAVHKTPAKTNISWQDNQSKVSTNLFAATNLRTKSKRLCTVTVDQHLLRLHCSCF